jgi:disulfide bond formation protein DsbB
VSDAGDDRLRDVLALLALVLFVVPVGGALWLGVMHGESPCILCWSQRTSMVLMALATLFVVRYGPRPRYIGTLVLLAAWGTFMALRHSALHLARDVGQGFSGSILGAHTYVWSWFIHWAVLLAAGALLVAVRRPLADDARWTKPPRALPRVAMGLLVVLVAANAVQAFITTGPPPFMGQSDPIRMSPDPQRWVWSTGALQGPVSWRGSWTIPRPDPSRVDPEPANGPLAELPVLAVHGWNRISATLEGNLADLAMTSSHAAMAVAVTEDYGVYVLDATLASVLHSAILDPGYSVDLSTLAGVAILGDTIAVMSTNKSWVLLLPDPNADGAREWRHFRRTDGTVSELRRGRFATVRARQQFALALAYDAEAAELVTVGVPSPRHARLVVSRFDRSDMTLSSEFLPRLSQSLAPGDAARSIAEYVVTGAVVVDGVLYAMSASYSTLLLIDLATRTLVAAYAVPGLSHPVGLAARGEELLITQADGRVARVRRPARPVPEG